MEEDDRGQGQGDPAENLRECPGVGDEEEDDEGFSFPVPPLSVDSCIVPVYSIFGRPPFPSAPPAEEDEPETATLRVPLGRLLLEEREFRARQQDGRSASARHRHQHEEEDDDDDEEEASAGGRDEELEGVPPESYCLWEPGGGGQASAPSSPRRCRKSGSTGSVLRWRRISDRLVGRSHSDGKEKFVFLNALPPPPPPPPANKHDEHEGSGGKGGDAAAGGAGRPWRYYGRGGGGAGGSGRRRSTYLPYKQELVGLFANVSGLRRSYHPF